MSELFNFGSAASTNTGVAAATSTESLVFNLNDVEETSGEFEVLPKGTYEAVVEEFEFTTSQAGSPMIKAVYTITDGEFEGRKIFDYYVLAGEAAKYALPKLKQLMTRVCPDINISAFNPVQIAEEGSVLNRTCQIKVAITTQKKGEYKGQKRNQIREILAADNTGSFLG